MEVLECHKRTQAQDYVLWAFKVLYQEMSPPQVSRCLLPQVSCTAQGPLPLASSANPVSIFLLSARKPSPALGLYLAASSLALTAWIETLETSSDYRALLTLLSSTIL